MIRREKKSHETLCSHVYIYVFMIFTLEKQSLPSTGPDSLLSLLQGPATEKGQCVFSLTSLLAVTKTMIF